MQTSNIDPRLLEGTGNIHSRFIDEDEIDSIEVDQVQVDVLRAQLLGTTAGEEQTVETAQAAQAAEANEIACLQTLTNGHDTVKWQAMSNYDFITYFSRLNIVNSTSFAAQWPKYKQGATFADSIGLYSVLGNSRDPPTPMMFQCQAIPGCTFTSAQKNTVVAHEGYCSPEVVAREVYRIEHGEQFHCDQCDKSFLTQHLLNMHIGDTHDFTPVPCPEGCDSGKIYSNKPLLKSHMRTVHSGIWPSRCLYPGCSDENEFKSSTSYANHLRKAHQLSDRAARSPHFPPTMKRTWQPTACDIIGCTNSYEYNSRSSLFDHLVKVHGFEKDAVKKALERGWVTRLSKEADPGHLKRKPRLERRPWVNSNPGNDESVDRPAQLKKRNWQSTSCNIIGCTNSHMFATKDGFVNHLVKSHGFARDVARKAAERGWVTQSGVDEREDDASNGDDDDDEEAPTKRRRTRH